MIHMTQKAVYIFFNSHIDRDGLFYKSVNYKMKDAENL